MEKTTPYISAGLVRDTYSDTVAMLAGIGLGKKIFENRRSRPLLSREKNKAYYEEETVLAGITL